MLFTLREIYGEDIPFHLNAGRWILANLSFPDKDPFTYTASEHKYIDMNWLYQVFMYGVYSAAGAAGLVLVNAFLVLGSVLLLFKRCRDNTSVLLPWMLLAAVVAISPILEIRPHSVSWLLLSLVLYVLQEYYNGNRTIIRWLPAIMLLWVNCHSLFILGLVVTGCYGVSVFVHKKEFVKEYLLWSSLAVLACLLNPYGWQGLAFPFEQLLSLQAGDAFKENIRELQSPFKITEYELTLKNIFLTWHFFDLFLLIAAAGLAARFKKIQIHEWLLLVVFFYFAYSATKNIGYFIFAVTPILAAGFGGPAVTSKVKNVKVPFVKKYFIQISALFLLTGSILLLSIRTNAFYIHYRSIYRFGLGWSHSNLPVKATEFLLQNDLNGKILNQMDLGGYLGFFTKQKVSLDGRLEVMGKELFLEQVQAVNPEAKSKLIEKYQPDIILFSYHITPDWITYFVNNSNWRLAYVDGSTAVYLKNGYAPGIKAADEKIFTASIPEYTDARIDELLKNKKNASLFSSLFLTQYYPEDELNQTFFCMYYGWVPAAKQITAKGFEKASSGYPECYQNLGTIYYEYKDKARALYCYEKYLEQVSNEHVEKRVRFLKSL